jgi:hypothetical protein
MAIDFTDPIQVQSFRQKAIDNGYKDADVERYIKKRVVQQSPFTYDVTGKAVAPDKNDIPSLTLGVKAGYLTPEQAMSKDPQVAASLLSAGIRPSASTEKLTESQQKFKTALTSAKDALTYLKGGLNTGPGATALGKIGEVFGKTGTGTEYRAALSLANTAVKSAFLGTAQSVGELKGVTDLIPKATDQESVAKTKLQKLIQLIGQQFPEEDLALQSGLSTDPRMALASAQSDKLPTIEDIGINEPVYNTKGDLASPGDLTRDPNTGKLSFFGEADQTIRIKRTSDGGEIDNNLITFLANSEFLPFAGSIAGGLMGAAAGPASAIGAGAAGSMAGKSMQQYFKEITDPDNNNISTSAKAVLTEGIVDAAISGLTFGIGTVAGKGIKLILKKTGTETAEEVGEGLLKSAARKRSEQLALKASKATPTQSQKFMRQTGNKFETELVNRNMVMPDKMAEGGIQIMKTNKAKLTKLLENKSAKTADVVTLLEDSKKAFVREVVGEADEPLLVDAAGNTLIEGAGKAKKVVNPAAAAGVSKIDDYITWVKSFGDDISGEELNDVKGGLQEVFGKSVEVAGESKELVANTSTSIKQMIEKFYPTVKGNNVIKDTNKELIFGHLAMTLGEKAMTTQKATALVTMTDFVTMAIDMKVAVLRKTIDLVGGADPSVKAQFLIDLFNLAKEKGNKNTMRKIIMAGLTDKVRFTIDPALLKTSLRAAKETGEAAIGNMVMQTEQPSLPASPSGVQMSNPGVDLGAFSPEGAPLYR